MALKYSSPGEGFFWPLISVRIKVITSELEKGLLAGTHMADNAFYDQNNVKCPINREELVHHSIRLTDDLQITTCRQEGKVSHS